MLREHLYAAVDEGATLSEYTHVQAASGILKHACSATATIKSVDETPAIQATPVNVTPLGVSTRQCNLAPWVLHSLSNLSDLSSDQSSTMIILRIHGKDAAESICARQIERMGTIAYARVLEQAATEEPQMLTMRLDFLASVRSLEVPPSSTHDP